jgi:DNA-binding winged helix-turn-helix (wHTH) protein/TolB-like protein
MADPEHGFAYEFGDWLVEPDLNRIRREGQEIQLEPRTLEVLRYLLERPGEIISVEELLGAVWQDVAVEPNAVLGNINRIRRALGDSARAPRYVETISTRGYRTIAPVRKVQATPHDAELAEALEAVTPPYPAYNGDEPYTFVCYSHQNREAVYHELVRLRSAGINVWYDEGISPGAEWTEEVANAIANCTHLLFFVSPDSVASKHCLDELSYAQERHKSLVVVYLEPTELPQGLQLSIGRIQALFKYAMRESEYARKLIATLHGAAEAPRGSTARPTAPRSAAPPSGAVPGRALRRSLSAMGVAALIAALTLLLVRGPRIDTVFRDEPLENTITVEAFKDLTAAHDQWIGDTIESEVRVALPGRGLQVVGSASYQGEREASVRERARYRVTGTVKRLRSRIRVTAELIANDTDFLIWTQIYDQPITQDAAPQSEIAAQIVAEVAHEIQGGAEQPLIATIPAARPAAGALQGALDAQQSLPEFSDFDAEGDSESSLPAFDAFPSFDDDGGGDE